jgi:phthiodiolone/phenolphthiodiolone dimycocerosates ketoreductase
MTSRPPVLGIGSGERMNTEPYGVPFDRPVSRFEEAIHVLRMCLDEPGSIDFKGEFYKLDRAPFDLRVPGRKPEIWVAAQGPRMLRIAGKYADGWLPGFGPSPERYESALRSLRDSARQAGRDPDSIMPSLQVGMALAPTTDEAMEALRSRHTRFHAVTSGSAETWRAVGHSHPLGDSYRGFVDVIPEDLDAGDLEDAMSNVPDEVLQETNLWGSVDDIVAAIRQLGDAGLRHISLIPSTYPVDQRLANYTWRVFPSIVRRLRE